ncbi:FkbM family methyltransferase [Lacrimispora sp.]|uniref:FkbM family methyltransferase n=1 Tax=Lacrimispora sp. TaxID=2719234 RepID=UPI0028B1CDF6|nr:FkbM family methyltransferase [Lacrimispora sp.]
MEKAILFGVGKNYYKLSEVLHKEYENILLVDNDPAKWGTIVDGTKIYSPKEVNWSGDEVVVILPGIFIAEGILQQLLNEYQVPFERIVFWEGGNTRLSPFYKDKKSGINIKLNSLVDNSICREVFEFKEYELGFGEQDVIVIDIGMNIGCASLYYASLPNVKYVYSFELVQDTFDQALKNIEMNPNISNKIIAHNFGLSNRDEIISVNTTTFSGHMTIYNQSDSGNKVECKIKDAGEALLPILEQHPNSKFLLKVDTEGSEYDIFDSLDQKGLLSRMSFIIGEWHDIDSGCNHHTDDIFTQEPLLEKLRQFFVKNDFVFKLTNVHSGIGYFYAFHI